jgi:hypothetical protein
MASMPRPSTLNITQLLAAWQAGDSIALELLAPVIHQELHRAARRYIGFPT